MPKPENETIDVTRMASYRCDYLECTFYAKTKREAKEKRDIVLKKRNGHRMINVEAPPRAGNAMTVSSKRKQ